jgi:hypothetical protein
MPRHRSSVERAVQRANGLPDERFTDSGWREGANGTQYLRVHLEADAAPVDKSAHSLYLDRRGGVHQLSRVETGESIADLVDPNGLK